MRLVKSCGGAPRTLAGQDAFALLRDAGDRLQHVIARYDRLVAQMTEGRSTSEMREGVELMNSQLAYVARRLQELIVAKYERGGDADEEVPAYSRSVAIPAP